MREMKDSGVEWIGKIPKDWEIVPLTKQLDSIVDYRGKTPEKTEEGTFLVTAKNIKDGKICYELSKEYVREADYEEIMHRGIPQIGDILFTTEAPLGQVANVDRTDIALAQRIIKFRALSTVNNYYLKYWMLNEGFQQFLHSLSTGSTATGIKSSKLFLLPLVRPNIEQQNKIVEYLDAKCSKIDEIVEKQKVIIEKLEEYKLSIITEAVTSGINPDVEMKDSGSVCGIQAAFITLDIDMADELIRKRERSLKGAARAKLSRTKEFDHSKWVGGGMLDYRFSNARRIVNDIYAGEVSADV